MFITMEDPNARIQGSRDPLGVQPIWYVFGRQVVSNLTTVTSSIRNFTVLILARMLTEKMIEAGKAGDQDALPIFLRAEQICSYARYVGHEDTDIRGIDRVKRFIEESSGKKVIIQDDANGLILSDQRVYGLWGIYSVSARASGLIADGPVGLTKFAREFAEKHYWPILEPVKTSLFALLRKGGTLRIQNGNPIFDAMVRLLPPQLSKAEKRFYAETLRDARRVEGMQGAQHQQFFASLLRQHSDPLTFTGRDEILDLANRARKEDHVLASHLEKIARLEALLAPAEALFDYLQTRGDQKPSDLANVLQQHWGRRVPNLAPPSFDDILPVVQQAAGEELTAVIKTCNDVLDSGDYEAAIETLLEWNKLVMSARKSAPWIQLTSGRLDVRYRGLDKTLPEGTDLPTLWANTYFIDALKSIVHKLGEVN